MPEVIVKGTRVHYLEQQAKVPGRGMKVALIHGSGGNAGMWQRVMAALAKDHASLAIDLPGHGQSRGEGMKQFLEYREFLKDFCETLGLEKIVLGGHSLGGGIVLDFALNYPGRLEAVLLIGTGARLRVLPEALKRLRQMAEGEIEPKFEPWGFAAGVTADVLSAAEREWAKTNSRVRYQDMLACDQFDVMKAVEKIHLPSLLVCGREDLLTPIKYSEYLKGKIPGSRMEIIEGAGHMVMLEAPEALSGVILAFLRSLDSSPPN